MHIQALNTVGQGRRSIFRMGGGGGGAAKVRKSSKFLAQSRNIKFGALKIVNV